LASGEAMAGWVRMTAKEQPVVPSFAVVGHPNKGKSSIVATLARDDSVTISPDPGTTIHCRRYPMRVDGELLYELIDTPGFQRARKALSWMQENQRGAADRPQIVREFVVDPENRQRFPDECQLLEPIVAGAGVLYVVDGSVPYSEEYDAELEILRWSGQPRLALINPISKREYIEQWRAALGQYFSVVRVFDALMAEFDKQVDLLRTFGQLQEQWQAPLSRAVRSLLAERRDRVGQAARLTAEAVAAMITLKKEIRISSDQRGLEKKKLELEADYHKHLAALEQGCRRSIEQLYRHRRVKRVESELEAIGGTELFSEESWGLFGLTKTELLTYGIVAVFWYVRLQSIARAFTRGSCFMPVSREIRLRAV